MRRSDLEILILESTDRIGGRLETDEILPGLVVNVGANWIMGNKNPILKYIQTDPDIQVHVNLVNHVFKSID